ncbi:MAG: hypothetical protein NTY54_01000 [Actinobacteria bacterium]|nr:hypothetical protein [Actinomycetota bacterium]
MLDLDQKISQSFKNLLLISGLVLLVGCSSPPKLSLVVATTATSYPSVTSRLASSVTTALASTTSSTLASNTTQVEVNRDQLVKQQFEELLQWQDKCYQKPSNCRVEEFTIIGTWQDKCYQKPSNCRVEEFTIIGTKYHQALAEQISLFAKNNINSRLGNGKREVKIELISLDDASLVADVDACIYDTVIMYMDGFIFNDYVTSAHTKWTLQWDNERWRWIDYQILHREYNTNICQYLP